MNSQSQPFVRVIPSLVHKDFEDDVLICNGRAPLPSFLPAQMLAQASVLGAEQAAALRSAYSPAGLPAPGWPAAEAGRDARLCLNSIPQRIPKAALHDAGGHGREVVLRNYRDAGDAFVLDAPFLREPDAIWLMNRFVERRHRLSDFERFQVSEALDALGGVDRPARYYANMVLDTTNYFFYRKHHEHVPGIMLIEVARQAMYAHYYRYSGQARGSVSLTINYLHVDYYSFADANYPVRVCVEDIRDPEVARSTGFEERQATFWQASRMIATVYMNAAPIRTQAFQRLRNVRPPEGSRFFPVKNIVRRAMLLSPDGRKLECLLHDLSTGGFRVTFEGDSGGGVAIGDPFDCIFFVDGPGYIDARVEVCWKDDALNGATAGLRILCMSRSAENRLRDTIKNYTFLNTSRETV